MGRQEAVARSVVEAITQPRSGKSKPLGRILTWFSAFFKLYQLPLEKIEPEVFANLRTNHWDIGEDDYLAAFVPQPAENTGATEDELPLGSIGDMGFSGSTFYSTTSKQYLVKSVPRYSEYSFFQHDLLQPYAEHMAQNPSSLLVRITDFLGCKATALGKTLGLAPSHHIVMENIMYGQEDAEDAGEAKWQNWDLKPLSYFYPERDIADGALTSEATKSQLADEFHGKIVLTKEKADEFFALLEEDTRVLSQFNATDYSLFLVRIDTKKQAQEYADPGSSTAQAANVVPKDPPFAPPAPPSWRTGVPSGDGKYVFRASILDFFWAKHKPQPRVMTVLVTLYNKLISKKGHMSITTTPEEYRERFLKMCHEIVEVQAEE